MDNWSIEDFYKQMAIESPNDLNSLLPRGIDKEIGHFNVFNVSTLIERTQSKPSMPYNRRAYYKISLISGKTELSMLIR